MESTGMGVSTHVQQFRKFALYNSRFNERLFSVALAISDEERSRHMGAFFGSIHGTLSHILLTDRLWLGRFHRSEHSFPTLEKTPLVFEFSSLAEILYPDFRELAEARRDTDSAIESWAAELTDAILRSTLLYTRSGGQKMAVPFWHAVAHFFNHQTHHRGQATALLSQLGRDPGLTDFIATALMD